MTKILKKYTIIPESLYVIRNADKQLALIVHEMERPGYVLVARQMGKTNLLFNAKRALENSERIFIYVDLSNYFEFERDCYRHIIDCVIEPNEKIFDSIINEITKIRLQELPAHNEYSKSLRVILNEFKGDIIIILDEIDALRTSEYSDHIFSQIRSNYFIRTNFPEFKRLTYILSGVIEPTELIKDRNKSPFNIGEKIYLDDFTREEHESFIRKSELNIKNEISDAIYLWANGSPRLTFDICSELENYIVEEKSITEDTIVEIINNKYLTNFDIAPIDHIRQLVKSDKVVRQAVYNIQKEIGGLTDDIKKRLYLYGVIGSSFNGTLKIKNKIIEKSLSIDWIDSIDRQTNDEFTYGLSKIDNKEYKEAIFSFLEFIKHSQPTTQQLEICNYNLGFAYYNLNQFDSCIEYFSMTYNEETYKNNALSFLGMCKIAMGEIEDGIKILEQVITQETHDFSYHNALLNLATHLPEKENDKALYLFKKLFESTFKSENIKQKDLNKLRTLSLYYQYKIHLKNNNLTDAQEKIVEARRYADLSDSVYLMFCAYRLSGYKNDNILDELISSIITNKLKFDLNNTYEISFKESDLLHYVSLVFNKSDKKLFDEIVSYSVDSIYGGRKNKYDILYNSIYSDPSNMVEKLNYVLENKESVDKKLLLNAYRALAFLGSESETLFFKNFDKYLEIIKDEKEIKSDDIYIFAYAINFYSNAKSIADGIYLCDIIDRKLSSQHNDDLAFESLIIYYWYALLYFDLKNNEKSIFYSNKALDLIKSSKRKRTSMIDEEGLKSIAEQMKQIKNSSTIRTPIISSKIYRRNDILKVKYLDGIIKEGKYKKLEADILAERCVIIK